MSERDPRSGEDEVVARAGRDPHVRKLARLFLEHPAWLSAARHVREGASSKVAFSHLPSGSWHLVREGGRSLLRPGPAADPDFAFRFTPAAIDRLAAARGGIGDFAVALFSLILEEDESIAVGFRILSSFSKLARRGYVRLLLAAGPRVVAWGAAHGVRTPGQLRRLVRELRAREPASWER